MPHPEVATDRASEFKGKYSRHHRETRDLEDEIRKEHIRAVLKDGGEVADEVEMRDLLFGRLHLNATGRETFDNVMGIVRGKDGVVAARFADRVGVAFSTENPPIHIGRLAYKAGVSGEHTKFTLESAPGRKQAFRATIKLQFAEGIMFPSRYASGEAPQGTVAEGILGTLAVVEGDEYGVHAVLDSTGDYAFGWDAINTAHQHGIMPRVDQQFQDRLSAARELLES